MATETNAKTEVSSVFLELNGEQRQIDMTLPLQMLFDDVINFVSIIES
ncbi:MAG: hypothetical protein LBK53_03385 [Heliobacteriaceae bacterium]|jgi:hypothetical protein|nr:hypothetical protein [Heliobacteriaceae bacterium]